MLNDTYYIKALEKELILAMGCTEPIAVALAAACSAKALGEPVLRGVIQVSGNILKNVKSVVVPNTGGLKGIKAAAVAGIVAGKPEQMLEVIADVTSEDIEKIDILLQENNLEVVLDPEHRLFDIVVTLYGKTSESMTHITNHHTEIVLVKKNGNILYEAPQGTVLVDSKNDYGFMSVKGIMEFAQSVDVKLLEPLLQKQVDCNSAISKEGLSGNYGANVGQTLLKAMGNHVSVRAKAFAAAGSDARMSGCELPVVINSGSGNQGMTICLPILEYAKEWNKSQEEMYRALILANLIAIYLKSGIGTLSAYCGAVSAGAAAAAGIAFLHSQDFEEIAHTLVNTLAITSGIICDGAKPSCAAKIASAIEAGILGWQMYLNGQQFYGGDGIIVNDLELTIKNIWTLGRVGMFQTDQEIMKMMIS